MAWLQLPMRLIVNTADVVRGHRTTALSNFVVVGWKLFLVADSVFFHTSRRYLASIVALERRSALEHIHARVSTLRKENVLNTV